MDQWNGNIRVPNFVPRPAENSFGFLYNYNYDQFPVLEMKQPSMPETAQHHLLLTTLMDHKNINNLMFDTNYNINDLDNNNKANHDPKKKRLSNEQLESLENSFQEEIKLDPERKQKLAKELGLQPRQIAVWFQNRRARWKVKQLERLYDALKKEYDAVAKEKHKLQQEVLALRAIVKEQVMIKKQVSTGYTEISNEETVESTSIPSGGSDQKSRPSTDNNITNHQLAECSYVLNEEDEYNQVVMMTPYNNWAA